MRNILLLSFALVLGLVAAQAQQAGGTTKPGASAPAKPAQPPTAKPAQPPTAKPAPPPQTAKPAPAPQPRRAAARPAARSGIALTLVDPTGATLPGVTIEMSGPSPREGVSDDSGQLNFPGLDAGTYRLRFTGDRVTAFEREVTLRAGQIEKLSIRLTPAPERPAPPPPPEPPARPAPAPAVRSGPAGEVQSVLVTDVLEKEFVGREPRRESLLSCSGNMRTTMIQLNEPLPDRLYADADAVYYVLGGEGTARLDGRDTRIATNGYVSVPRGTMHTFARRGNRPLILLAVLSGEPCEQPK